MTEALRFNKDKPELHYLLYYPRFMEALARVQMQGAIKYGYGNWLYGGKSDLEYWDSGLRHLASAFNKETFDKDSGCHTLAQAVWNFMQIIEQNYRGPVFDPDFDQQAYVDRWADHPKQEKRF
jgi:hypothetical protein